MIPVLRAAASTILLVGVIYLLGAFVAADLDFRQWDIVGRIIAAIGWCFLSPVAAALGYHGDFSR